MRLPVRWLVLSALALAACPPAPTTEALTVTPAALALQQGEVRTVAAKLSSGASEGPAVGAVWSSNNEAVATVSSTGDGNATVEAVGEGIATVTVKLRDASARVSVTVSSRQATLSRIELTPARPTLARGTTQQLVATGVFSDQSTRDLTAMVAWASSDEAVATVSAGGLLTAVGAGSSTVSALQGSVQGSTTVTVTDAQLVALEVTPTAPTLARGTTLQLTATARFADNSTQDVTAQVSWLSDNTAVASVNAGLVTAVDPGTASVSAQVNGVTGSTTVTVTAATLIALELTPPLSTVAVGGAAQLTATGRFSDSSTQDLTGQVSWSSSATTVAIVSTTGLVNALAPGNATITASQGGISGTAQVTVSAAQLVSLEVTPASPSVARGLTLAFTATGTFSDATTRDLTGQVIWSSTFPTVASVSNAAGTRGVATGQSVGSTTITATSGSVAGSTTLTVTAAVLTGITITPAAPTVARGATLQLTATGTFSDATTQDLTASVTWLSGMLSVATVSNGASDAGLLTALGPGSTSVSAALGAVVGSTTVTVTAAQLVSLAVTGAPTTLPRGRTVDLVATGTYSDATTAVLTTQVTWTSAPSTTASVSNAAGTEGRVTGLAPGSVTVTATLGGVSGNTSLTVVPAVLDTLTVTPATASVAKGRTQQFTANGTYSDSTTQNLTSTATWASTSMAVATVNGSGLASTLAVGSTTISATVGTVSGSAALSVTAAVLDSIAVTPPGPSLAKGRTLQLVATGTWSDLTTTNVTATATWSSGTPAAATVSNVTGTRGLASAVNVGSAVLTATVGTVSGATTLTVTPAALDSIAVTPANPSLAKGLTQQFTATGTYSDASTQNLTGTATWASATSSVATITTGGLATAAGVGTSSISATVGSVSGSTVFTVTPAQLVSLAVTPVNPTVNAGSTVQLTATGTYTDSTTQNLSTTAVWATGSGTIATVSTSGLVTGNGAGTTSISATVGSSSDATQVTVNAPPPVVLSTVPVSGATGVSPLAALIVTFDRAVAPATVTVQSAGGTCSGSVQVSRDDFATCAGLGAPVLSGGNTVVSVTPAPALVNGGSYKLRVTASVTSAFGTPLASAFTLTNPFLTTVDGRCASGLVISQLYGSGGNTSALFSNDFVELHNPTGAAISVAGHAVQYASATGTTWSVTTLTGSVPAGGYYLVQLASGGAVGAALPTPDATGTSNMSATAGKVALTSSTTALTGNCPTGWVDFIGYGTTADCFRTARAPAQAAATADVRKRSGCADENDNSQDYAAATPTPRNTASTPVPCACTMNETDRALEADYCALQFPPTLMATAGMPTPLVYGRLFEAGVTEPGGAAPNVRAEVGYGPATVNPQNQPGYVWTPATFNLQAGNDDEYQASFTAPAAGSWRYTTRFSLDGTNWTYCDLDGAGSNPGLTFDLPQLGVLTVTP